MGSKSRRGNYIGGDYSRVELRSACILVRYFLINGQKWTDYLKAENLFLNGAYSK